MNFLFLIVLLVIICCTFLLSERKRLFSRKRIKHLYDMEKHIFLHYIWKPVMLGPLYYIFYTNVECSVKHVACLRSL